MKKFDFRLEPLFNLRKQEEKSIQKELMKLKNNYNQLEEKLKDSKQDKWKWRRRIKEEQAAGTDSTTLIKYNNYIEYLNDQIQEIKLEMEYWQEKISECQDRLLDKMKERKKIGKLKERKAKEHWEEFLEEERKQTDEVATNNYNHQQVQSFDSII